MEDKKIIVEKSEVFLSEITLMSREKQLEIMKTWFLENYEDPAENTPYESGEGGYIYIFGGPYDADDELSLFCDYVPEDVLEELANDLSGDQWVGVQKASDYEEEYINRIISDNEFYKSFKESINHITQIIQANVKKDTKNHLLGLLHVSVITAIETYLSGAFINTVINDHEIIKKFVERNPEFKKRKFKLSEIYNTYANIKSEVKKYLLSIMWHNLHQVKPLYKATLNIDFPSEEIVNPIFKSITERHDLVHRNGKDKQGQQVKVTEDSLNELINCATNFINFINVQLDSTHTDK